MNDAWDESLKAYFLRTLPLLCSIILVMMSYMPFNILLPTSIHPAMGVICVYYWMLHRPDVFNLFSVFCLGLVEDLITAAPLGANLFQLLVLYVLISNLLKYFNGKPFEVMWGGFLPAAFLSMFARWFVVSVYYGQFLPLGMLGFSVLITVAAYPIISLVNVLVQNKFMADEV